MEVKSYDPTIPFYVIVNEDYQDKIPAGSVAVAEEVEDGDAWGLWSPVSTENPFGTFVLVPAGSQAELFTRTGDVARPAYTEPTEGVIKVTDKMADVLLDALEDSGSPRPQRAVVLRALDVALNRNDIRLARMKED